MDFQKDPVAKYYGLPGNLWLAIKKYYRFTMATAQTEILRGQKNLYMSVLLMLLTILTYKWNLFVAGWDSNSILFIPHITKIYLVFLVMLYVVFKGFLRPWNRKIKLGVFEKVSLFSEKMNKEKDNTYYIGKSHHQAGFYRRVSPYGPPHIYKFL